MVLTYQVVAINIKKIQFHNLFSSLEELQEFATQWLWSYNNERPNMAIDGIPPRQKLALVEA